MTTDLYFIRHCQPNYHNHDDYSRELSQKGLQDRQLVLDYFADKKIDTLYSSPYKRGVDTISPLAEKLALDIQLDENFRERQIDQVWIEDFTGFIQKQWADFSYKLSDGESLQEVQDRNISALMKLLDELPNKSIVVGSHGTALSTIINYYSSDFGYESFNQFKSLMPFVAHLTFDKLTCLSITIYNPFTGESYDIYSL